MVETEEPVDGEEYSADVCEIIHRGDGAGAFGEGTATFIAHARTDVPRLMDIVCKQGARIAELEATIKQMEEDEHDRRMEAMEEYD